MKRLFCCVAFLLFVGYAARTQTPQRLTIDQIFSGELSAESLGEIQWLSKKTGFTAVFIGDEGNELLFYPILSGAWQTMAGGEALLPKGHHSPINIESYSWSPDETRLMIFTNSRRVWRQNTRGDYWVYDVTDKSLRQIGKSLPASSLMFAKFSPDNRHVAYVCQNNLYVEDFVTGEITQLTFDGTQDVINGTFDWAYEEDFSCRDGFRWSHDGSKIAFWQIDATGIRDFLMINNTDSLYSFTIPVQYPKVGQDPSSAKIGVVEVATKETIWMKIPGDSKQHYLPRMQWVDGRSKLLVQQLNRKQNEWKIFKCDVSTGESNVVYEEKEKAWIEIFGVDLSMQRGVDDLHMLDNGKAFMLLSEKDGWRHAYKVSLDGGKAQLLTPGDYDIATIYHVDDKNGYLYFNASPDNATRRFLYRLSMKKDSKVERLTPSQFAGINLYDFSPDGKYAIHNFSSINTPDSYTLVALPSHVAINEFVDNEALKTKLKDYNLPKGEFFKVTTADGIEMDGRMIKPANFDASKKYPVLFHVYGEPWGQTAVNSWEGLWEFYVAQQGYIVITMDNRGTPTLKGREWRKSIYRKIGVINSRDQAMATKEILKWKFIDSGRTAVWGWSGGGSMTLNLLFRYPEIYQTGMAVAAVANQLYYDNIYQERYMGVPWETEADYVEGSPISYAKNLEGNLLYIHGTGDDNVHYQNAEALINELVARGKQFDLMIYPNRSHSINEGSSTTLHLYHLLYRYLTEHTPPGGK
ncbi:MAG: S9 family peptidase [Cyclobacteriaceae bacterium]|nr:S9 family peptidase [Cyclobacteriaceae bacterium]